MDTVDLDPVCDLPSIAAVKSQLFKRWFRTFTLMFIGAILISAGGAVGLYYLSVWAYPLSRIPSLQTFVLGGSVFALLICAPPISRMLWLDFKVHRRLSAMARRVAAGEIVRASEIRL
jgi:hypothetical protein